MYKNKQVTSRKKKKLILITSCVIFITIFACAFFYYIINSNRITDFSSWNSVCPYELIVVNKDNPAPEGLVTDTVTCGNKPVGKTIYEDLENLISAAKNDGIDLWVGSGYRSIDYQKNLYDKETENFIKKGYKQEDAKKEAAKNVAMPGTSEHQLGLAVDFNNIENSFVNTEEYAWLCKNSYKYGFIERYPKNKSKITGITFEPWHFRYVGVEKAKEIKDSGLCLEEYISKQINESKN